MSFESNTGLNVNNHYGPRPTGNGVGVIKTEGAYNELSVDVTGEMLNNTFRPTVVIPAGSLIVEAFVDISEEFDLGGTTPTILVGTATSEVTNGLVVSETLAEAVATTDITSTLTGTWDASLAAATTVGVVLGGTTPTADATVGKGKIVVRYINV